MEEEIDEDHSAVAAIRLALSNHGWGMSTNAIIDLVKRATEAVARYDQQNAQQPDGKIYGRRQAAESIAREVLPETLYDDAGDKPEIPDDLYEEIATAITDEHGNR